MFKHRVNGANSDRVNRASSASVACPDGSPCGQMIFGEPWGPKAS